MAEAAVFGICSVVLATIASPAVRSGYEKIKGIKNALSDLYKLKESVEMIQAVLLDAEKRQNEHAVKLWIKRVQDVLYDAEDLFDGVATYDMRKKAKRYAAKNPISFAFLRGIAYKKSIAKGVKSIGKEIDKLSTQMREFGFICSPPQTENYGTRRGNDPGFVFVGSDKVIGRVKEKKAILKMVLLQSSHDAMQNVSILAIVGIGGMGKTTLAHLVYEDEKVKERFKDNRWFLSISNASNDEEVVRKIYLSVCKASESQLPSKEVQHETIKKALKEKFLLVLDDVWDDDHNSWARRMGLWSRATEGSKVIVTTRSNLVARAMGASEHYQLDGLSEKESWDLFESIVQFTREQKFDPEWASLGREMVMKCANSPLAIRSLASLLREKDSIEEWRIIRNEELLKIGHDREDGIKQVLLLSYHHLSPTLKRCFAYLSLFPKSQSFKRNHLIRLWTSQGYVDAEGLSCFLGFVRRSFLQVHDISFGESYDKECSMHDLIHDLAQEVASEECIILPAASGGIIGHRHLRVDDSANTLWLDAHPQSNYNRVRSFLCTPLEFITRPRSHLVILFPKFKCLRALVLAELYIFIIPDSIGELKHLRYLDISRNSFETLPDSITRLVNLYFLDISRCYRLAVLPSEFRRLTNIRALRNDDCTGLMGMPPGFEELTNLQDLSEFYVSRVTKRSKLGELSGLKLRGELRIVFLDKTDEWDGIQFWHPPPTLESLSIIGYEGPRIPRWGNEPKLIITSLTLLRCTGVKCLPPLSHLPKLNKMSLTALHNLEYVQGEGDEEEEDMQSPNAILPDLKELNLERLPELVSWSRKVENTQEISFHSLHDLWISDCPKLNHLPSCPNLVRRRDNIMSNMMARLWPETRIFY